MAVLAAISLDPLPTSARRARRFVEAKLHASGAEKFSDGALLLTSEVVTNVIRHVRSIMTLTIFVDDRHVRISVSDHGAERPRQQRAPDPLDPGGRGLELVDAVSTSWGVEETDEGKAVWFQLAG